MKLNDIKVGSRLAFAFGLVLLITALMSGIGVWRLQELADTTQRLATTDNEKLQLAVRWRQTIDINWVRTRAAILDDRRASDYYRLVEGGTRLLWGGRITTRAASADGVARELRRAMLDVYPQLAPLKTELVCATDRHWKRHAIPVFDGCRQRFSPDPESN